MSEVQFTLGAVADIATGSEVRSAVQSGTDTILTRLDRDTRHHGNRIRIPQSYSPNPAATGSWVLDFGSPSGGDLWWIVEVLVTAADDRTTPGGTVTATATGAAAAAGSAALPAGATITGFDLFYQTPALAGNSQVTVTNVAGGTLTYDVSQLVASTGLQLSIRYSGTGIAASTSAAQPTVNVPAEASGGAWSLNVFGTTAPPTAALYCGSPARQILNNTVDGLALGALVRPAQTLPATFTFAKESWPVKDGENLFAVVYSPATALSVMSGSATVTAVPAATVSRNRG